MKKKIFKQTIIIALAMVSSTFAQVKPIEQLSDSLNVPKNFENYNGFQIESWGPVTYKGEGKCDVLDLYQSNVTQGLGYSTIVDYHYKQVKHLEKYTCESWGLGLSFKVIPDTNAYSRKYNLSPPHFRHVAKTPSKSYSVPTPHSSKWKASSPYHSRTPAIAIQSISCTIWLTNKADFTG